MRDWNAVITVHEGGFVPACRLLEPFGTVRKTEFFNTLVMRAADPFRLMADLHGQLAGNPVIADWISRFMPLQQLFNFQSVAEFELRSREAVLAWLPRLANARFISACTDAVSRGGSPAPMRNAFWTKFCSGGWQKRAHRARLTLSILTRSSPWKPSGRRPESPFSAGLN